MKKQEAGFFLLETLILGMIVTALALVCYSYLFLNWQRLYCEGAVTASFLAQKQIALIEARPAAWLRSVGEVPWLEDGASPVERNHRQFYLTSRITDSPYGSRLRSVEVTVAWEEQGKRLEQSYRKLVRCDD